MLIYVKEKSCFVGGKKGGEAANPEFEQLNFTFRDKILVITEI